MDAKEKEIRDAIEQLADKRYGAHDCATLKKLFLSYDKDGNNALDKTELENLLEDAGVCSNGFLGLCPLYANGIFDRLDKSGDEQIDWTEYLAASTTCKEPAPSPAPSGEGGADGGLKGIGTNPVSSGALANAGNVVPKDTSLTTGEKAVGIALGVGLLAWIFG